MFYEIFFVVAVVGFILMLFWGFCFVLNACDVLVGVTGCSVDVKGTLALPLPQGWVKQDGDAQPPMVAL